VKSRPFGGGNTYVLLLIIDAQTGKKLQDFSKILRKFYKTVQKLHFQSKKGPTRAGSAKQRSIIQDLTSRPTSETVCHKAASVARLRIPFL